MKAAVLIPVGLWLMSTVAGVGTVSLSTVLLSRIGERLHGVIHYHGSAWAMCTCSCQQCFLWLAVCAQTSTRSGRTENKWHWREIIHGYTQPRPRRAVVSRASHCLQFSGHNRHRDRVLLIMHAIICLFDVCFTEAITFSLTLGSRGKKELPTKTKN